MSEKKGGGYTNTRLSALNSCAEQPTPSSTGKDAEEATTRKRAYILKPEYFALKLHHHFIKKRDLEVTRKATGVNFL